MLDIDDLLQTAPDGRGVVNVLAAERLLQAPKVYASFLLWMLSELFERLKVRTWTDFERLVKEFGASAGKLAGTISSRNDRRTRKGTPMAIVGLSDATGSFEVIAFSEQITQFSDVLQAGKSVILTVEADERPDGIGLRLIGAEPIERAAERVGKELRIFVDAASCLGPIRSQLRPGGEGHVIFVIPRGAAKDYEVDVPDFSKLPLSMSGVVVNATPPIPTPPNDNMRTLVPISSTTRRQFSAVDAVTTFARVYQSSSRRLSAVTVTSRVYDVTGKAVFSDVQTLAPAAFQATRGADHRLSLPVHRFSPGPHILTIEAVAGRGVTARRDVRFEMR